MSNHGVFSISEATLVEIEEYEETIKEKREIVEEEPEPAAADAAGAEGEEKKEADAPMPDAEGGDAAPDAEKKEGEKAKPAEAEKKEEAPKPKKEVKYEWVDVKKAKKRTKRTPLAVIASERPGLKAEAMIAQKDEESKMQTESAEVKENDDKKNEVETYIYKMKDEMINTSGKLHEYMPKESVTAFETQLTAAEDWLYDHFDASTLELCDKLQELEEVGKPAQKRFETRETVKDYLPKCQDAIKTVRSYVNNMSEDFAHIAQAKKNGIIDQADALEAWIMEMQQKEKKNPLFEEAVFLLADLKAKEDELRINCNTVMKEPKPAPAPEEPKPAEGTEGSAEPSAEAEAKPDAEMKADAEEAPAAEGAGTEGKHEEAAPAAEGSTSAEPMDTSAKEAPEAPAAEPAGAGMEVD